MQKLAALLLCLLLSLSLLGCSASRRPFTKETFSPAAEAVGLSVTEVDPATLGQENVTSITAALKDQTAAQVIVFTTAAAARSLYATILSTVGTGKTEKQLDSTTYNKYYGKNEETFVAVIRMENTLFFGQDNGSGEIKTLLEKLEAW